MTTVERVRRIFSPPAEVSHWDTGLRFTDILFGFVIRELFLRLQNWVSLSWFVRWQLIAGTTLVLGSWIGFRRSLYRSSYELKFFNLPLIRFVIDQGMVILYFRMAVLTPTDPTAHVGVSALVNDTLTTLLLIFALYAIWDIFGIVMAAVGPKGNPKYGVIENNAKTNKRVPFNVVGLLITLVVLAMLWIVSIVQPGSNLSEQVAEHAFIAATVLLLLYRFAKEVRTSWQMP